MRRAEPTGLVRGQGVCVCERGVNAILRGCKRPPAGGVNLQVYTPRRRGWAEPSKLTKQIKHLHLDDDTLRWRQSSATFRRTFSSMAGAAQASNSFAVFGMG